MRVQLGNSAAKQAVKDADGELVHTDLPGRRITTVDIPDTYTLMEALATITAGDGVWNHHSRGEAVDDNTPDWVESDNPTLAAVLADHFGCPAGRPEEWVEDDDQPKPVTSNDVTGVADEGLVTAQADDEIEGEDAR